MRHYKQISNGVLVAIDTGFGGIEITKDEYDALLTEIRAKAQLTNKLYKNEITIADVPAEWQEEIQERVNQMIEDDKNYQESDISADEFYQMVEDAL